MAKNKKKKQYSGLSTPLKEVKRFKDIEKKQIKERTVLRNLKNRRTIGGFLRGIQSVAKRGITQSLYDRQQPRLGIQKTVGYKKSNGRGRPKGSYDPRYAKYGGVYGYRKFLSNQLRIQRIQALRQAAVTPRQQLVIDRIERREQNLNLNPERRVIPSTSGMLPINNIMQEIDSSANLVD